jgi:hypothetical protein
MNRDDERMDRMIRRWQRGPTIGDRIGVALLYGFFGLIFVGGWVFICLMVLHMLPCEWYTGDCA